MENQIVIFNNQLEKGVWENITGSVLPQEKTFWLEGSHPVLDIWQKDNKQLCRKKTKNKMDTR